MMSASNQRAYPRYSVRLDAVAVTPRGDIVECKVEDFCQGGMFITFPTKASHTSLWAKEDRIEIRFSQGGVPKGQAYIMQGRVARMIDIGIGIRFSQMDGAAFRYLNSHRAQTSKSVAGLQARSDTRYAAIIAGCRNITRTFLESLVDAFVMMGTENLDKSEDLAIKNWRGVMETQQKLRQQRQQLLSNYVIAIMGEFEQKNEPANRQDSRADTTELSLVDDNEFQNWLTVTTLATKLDNKNEAVLRALEQRLTVVLNRPIDHQNNPIGPVMLARHFEHCYLALELEAGVEGPLFRALEEFALLQSGHFFEQVNTYLKEQGILPDLKQDFHIAKQPDTGRRRSLTSATPLGEVTHGLTPAQAPVNSSTSPPSSVPTQNATAGAAAPIIGDGDPVPAVEQSLYAAANELLQLERTARETLAATTGRQAVEDVGTRTTLHFSPHELDSGLRQLQERGVSIRRLRQQGTTLTSQLSQVLMEQGGGDTHKQLPLEVQDKLEVTESLLSSIQTDPITDNGLKDWFASVELPFIKMAMNNEQVLKERSHPVHYLLNTLEQLFQMLSPEQSELRAQLAAKVESVLKNLGGEAEADPAVLDEVVTSLNKLHGEQLEKYRRRVDEVIAECEKQPSRRQIMLEMIEDIEHLFDLAEGRLVPRIILALMDAGWKNLLWRFCQREGVAGDGYRGARATMEQLLVRLQDKTLPGVKHDWPNHKLVEEVSKVLERLCQGDVHSVELVDELISSLEQVSLEPSKKSEIKRGALTQRLRDSWEQEKLAAKPVELSQAEWNRWVKRANALDDGELVSYKSSGEEPRQLKLIWSDRKWDRFVFVDREGEKALEVGPEEIAAAMSRGYMLILEGWDRPLMDRATYTMLQSIHDRLIEQTNHDALTSLMNRRGFESALGELLARAKKDGSANVLCYFDLDRFNVINVTCGHAAGDELLGSLVDILRKLLGPDVVLARLGGDEFAVLLEGCDRAQGMVRSEEIHRAISNYRFRCENKEFAVDASFGVATIDPKRDSVRTLLAAVDSACFAAKDAGRGRIQFYDPDSEVITRRQGVMEWVGRINKLFEAGLIQLKCQKISSLKFAHEHPRYEILLHVQNENGELVSPEQFVMSAEIYNRILDIDRWVVDKVFAWLRANQEKLSGINFFSINLSGHSIDDEAFMEELLSRLETPDVPVCQICFEITETAAISSLERAVYYMRRMQRAGCKLALDDFGSGHASYNYLRTMPVDFVKIDGQFTRNIATNVFDFSVVKSIQEMVHAVGKRTIAEHIEDAVVLDKLRKIGVDFGQGYLIERPVPLDELVLTK